MKKKTEQHWQINITDSFQNMVQTSYFDGTWVQCKKYVKENFLNRKNPRTPNGSRKYFNPKTHLIMIRTSFGD